MAEREESQGYFEMLWDCEFCEARGLLGKSQRYCANCGGPQNPAKRYFPQPGEERRVDGHLYEGADRTCPACSAPQSARAHNCTHCGSVLDGAADVRGVADPTAQPRAAPKPARRRRRIWLYLLIVLAVLAAGIWWRCIRTQEAQVVVAAHQWKRAVIIEEYNDRQEEAWRNEIPAGASPVPVCYDKQRSTRKVADGEECHTERHDKKDGTFEQVKKCNPKYRTEPVMDSWCKFDLRRWRTVDEAKATGNGLSPAWPTNLPPGDTPAVVGARRQGKRTETLTLQFTGHGSCDVEDPVWRKYTDGQKLKVEVHSSGDVACSSL